MSTPKISVIVPVYNVHAYLERCVRSLLGQTFSAFEMILVDDGSTDDSGALCDGWAEADPRIRVCHQQNGGLSNARNTGTKLALGQYVTYVDSDDFVEPYYLEYLLRAAEEADAPLAVARVDRRRAGDDAPAEHRPEFAAQSWTRSRALGEILTSEHTTVSSGNKLGLRELYLQTPFPEGRVYEDLFHTALVMRQCSRVAFADAVLYHYMMNPGSITSRKTTTVRQCLDYEAAVAQCTRVALECDPTLTAEAAVLTARDYMSLYLTSLRCPEQPEQMAALRARIRAWFRQNWRTAAANPHAPRQVRARVALMRLSPTLYRAAYYAAIHVFGKTLG